MIAHVAWRQTRRAASNLWRTPLPSLVAVLTIGLSLFLAASFLLLIGGAQLLLRGWGAEASLTLYLEASTSDQKARALAAEVARLNPELEVTYVDKGQALDRLRQDLGDLAVTLDGLSQNPLPPMVELRPRQHLSVAEVRALAARLAKLPSVAEVDYGREWLDRLEALTRALRATGLGASLIVLGAAVLVVANTIRLAVYARRDEIEIMKLVGATDGYVRMPFLLEGALQGLAGAALALGGLWSAQHWLLPQALSAFRFASGLRAAPLGGREAGALLAFGAAVGLVGSYVAVARFLRTST
jgi:cell division transport system permease protein